MQVIYLNEKITKLETTPVLTVEELREHLRVPHQLDDGYIAELVEAATAYAERYTNRFLKRRRITASFALEKGIVKLRGSEISEFKALDQQGNIVPCLMKRMKAELLKPATEISYESGYYTTEVPADIKAALKLLVGSLYIQRADVSVGVQYYKCALTADKLLQFYKLP